MAKVDKAGVINDLKKYTNKTYEWIGKRNKCSKKTVQRFAIEIGMQRTKGRKLKKDVEKVAKLQQKSCNSATNNDNLIQKQERREDPVFNVDISTINIDTAVDSNDSIMKSLAVADRIESDLMDHLKGNTGINVKMLPKFVGTLNAITNMKKMAITGIIATKRLELGLDPSIDDSSDDKLQQDEELKKMLKEVDESREKAKLVLMDKMKSEDDKEEIEKVG